MDLIATTAYKKMAPKKGYCHVYVKFPNGFARELIGKNVSIFQSGNDFILVTDKKNKDKMGLKSATNSINSFDQNNPMTGDTFVKSQNFGQIDSSSCGRVKPWNRNQASSS